MCVGNGETAKRVSPEGMTEVPCPTPDSCEYAKSGGCKPYGRLNVAIEGQDEELSSFVFRTTGFNSIRTLTARLQYFEAVSGGNTRYLPLQLKLRGKSTTQSHRAPVYYVDLCLRDGITLEEAVTQAISQAMQSDQAGVGIKALEQVALAGLANGAFEDSEEEAPAIVEEFYSETGASTGQPTQPGVVVPIPTKLTNKLAGNDLASAQH
jgi:hypothetical protein